MSLQKQAINSVKWTTLKTGIVAATGPLLQIVLARFLLPEGFAYIAIIMIFIGLFMALDNFGISQAIIQRDSISVQEASSLLYFNIFLSIILGLLLYYSSSLIAGFFSLPDLDYYLKLTSLVVVIGGPAHIFRALLQKQLFFKEIAFIEISNNMLRLVIVITLLFFEYGVVAVIYGHIFVELVRTISTAIVCIRSRLVKIMLFFNINDIKPFLKFGAFAVGKQLVTFSAFHLDEIVIGYFLPPEILGVYYFGKNMLEKLRQLITSSFGQVLYPVFAKLKHEIHELASAYQKVTFYLAFLAFPVFTGIAVTAHLFVPIIFGEQWTDSIIVFQVFSLSLIFKVLTAHISSTLLYALNKPEYPFYIDLSMSTIYILTLILFASRGMLAVLIVYSLYTIFWGFIYQYFCNKQFAIGFSIYFDQLKTATIFSTIMAVVVMFFQTAAKGLLNMQFVFISSIVLGAIVYYSLVLLFQGGIIKELKAALIKGSFS